MIVLPRRPTAVEWAGSLPAAWRERRAKFLFSRLRLPPDDEHGVVTAFRDGQVTLRKNRRTEGFTFATKEIGYQGVRVGHLVIHSMDGFAGAIGVSESDGKCSPVYVICEPKLGVEGRYYAYVLRHMALSGYITSLAKGIRERSTSFGWGEFKEQWLPAPTKDTQKAIADFLDRKTAAIDALIAKKQRLLDLLAEKRAALINQAVTKGLDPSVPMKDSGIPWIGEIPAHWGLTVVKRACSSVRDGTHGPPPRFPAGEHRLLSARNIQNGRFILRDDDRRMSPEAFAELERSYTVREGDVVLASVGATTGKSAVVGPIRNVSVQRSLAILRPNHRISSAYLHTWLDASVAQHAIQLKASQYAAQGGIYLEDVANLPLVLPSKPEQARLLEATAPRLDRMRRMAANLSDSCIRLQEYRQALITAAVTGQLDITGEVAA